jgi:hypothetical protein
MDGSELLPLRINEPQRMLMIPLGILVGISIATTYAFGLVSNKLKEQFGLDQEDLTTISTVGSVFSNFALPGGALFDFAGPRVTLLAASLMSFVGMGLLSLSLSSAIPASVLSLSAANALLSWGASWMDVSSLATNLLQFPCDKGAVIILQKTFQGLGSSVVAAYYSGFFPEAYAAYTGFVAFMILVHGFTAAALMRLPPFVQTKLEQRRALLDTGVGEAWRAVYDRQPAPQARLRLGFVLLGATLVFLTANSIVTAYVDVPVGLRTAFALIVMLLTLSFFLLAVPRRLPFVDSWSAPAVMGDDVAYTRISGSAAGELRGSAVKSHGACDQPPASPEVTTSGAGGCGAAAGCAGSTTSAAFVTTSFHHNVTRGVLIWLMFWTSLCNLGAGMVFIVNCAQIFTAGNDGHDDHKLVSLIVSLMGVSSAVGRILVGIAEMWLDRRGRSVSLVYPLPSIAFCVCLGLGLLATKEWLILPFCIATFGHGFMCAVTVMTIRQTFAVDLGKHYTMVAMGGLVASVGLNRFTFGVLFDKEARAQGTYPRCVGHGCVNTAFLVLLLFNASAVVSAITVHFLRENLAKNHNAGRSALDGSSLPSAADRDGEMTDR